MPQPFRLPYSGIEHDFDVLLVDTEFTRLPLPSEGIRSWINHARVLSVAVVAFDRTVSPSGLYCVRRLDAAVIQLCTDFVKAEVIPYLDVVQSTGCFHSEAELQVQLKRFLSSRRRKTGKDSLLGFDWAGDAFLLEQMLPENQHVLLIQDIPAIKHAADAFFTEEYQRHNAYHDALAIRHGFANYVESRN